MYKTPDYKRSGSPDGLKSSVFKAIRNVAALNSGGGDYELRSPNMQQQQCPLVKMEEGEEDVKIMDLRAFASNTADQQQQQPKQKLKEKNVEPSAASYRCPKESPPLPDDTALTVRWVRACSTGDLRTVGNLLKQKPYLISYAPAINHGLSGLHYAAKGGHSGVLRFLLSKGADINLRTSGYTPLHLAAIGKQHGIIAILLRDYGADPSIADYSGRTYKHHLMKAQRDRCTWTNNENAEARAAQYESHGGAPADLTQFSRLKSIRKVVQHGRMRFFGDK